jgi:glycosyltransferase involved in cell wall biosynthesis
MREIQSLNRSPRIALISPLPADQEGAPQSGVGQYLVELLERLSDRFDVTVLAAADTSYRRIGHAKVVPSWTPDSRCVYQILRALNSIRPDVVHLQHEFNLFGGLLPTALLSGAIVTRRSLGPPMVTTLHGVVEKSAMTPAFLAHNNLPPLPRAARAALDLAYRTITMASSKVIVHHEHFQSVLRHSYGVDGTKIEVIPFGSDHHLATQRSVAKRRSDARSILVLGFLAGYKMPELVVQLAEEKLLPNAVFHFVVGRNPRINSAQYDKRYSDLANRVQALGSRATWSGYVPDEELSHIFSKSDVVVLPYTECVSGSAVASLAQAHGLSVCYSRALRPLFGTSTAEFDLNTQSLACAILAKEKCISKRKAELTTWARAAERNETIWAEVAAIS